MQFKIFASLNARVPSGLILLSAICTSLLLYYINFDVSAITHPAVDNLPAVSRILDKDYLAADFFTNASSILNPRSPYVYFLTAITYLYDAGIGGGLAVMKSLLVILLPFAIILASWISTNIAYGVTQNDNYDQKSRNYLIVCVLAPMLVFFLQSRFGTLLSVAWWFPLYFDGTAQNLSIALALLGFSSIPYQRPMLGAMLVLLSGFIHPAASLFTSAFSYTIFSRGWKYKNDKTLIYFGVVPCLLSVAIVAIVFAQKITLGAAEFIRIYVFKVHPYHYLPSEFESFQSFEWYKSFLIVISCLVAISFALYMLQCKAWKNALVAALIYGGAILAQYFFVEVYQVKSIAVLGPARFTLFGPWFVGVFSIILLVKLLDKFPGITAYSNSMVARFKVQKFVIILFFLLLLCVSVVHTSKANNFNFLTTEDKDLFRFVTANTGKSDVFILPVNQIRIFLPLKTNRAVFLGNGFPFTEKYLKEYEHRHALINGSREQLKHISGTWIGERFGKFYQNLSPADFIRLSENYKSDWVVVESAHSQLFDKFQSEYASKSYKVFSIKKLKEFLNK